METAIPSLQNQLAIDCEENSGTAPEIQASKHKQIISTLPKVKLFNDAFILFHYRGFWFFENFLEGIMSSQEHFQPQPTDIFVASSPKTGTTWLKALTFAIVTRTRFHDSTSPLLNKLPHDCIPFLEVDLAMNWSSRDTEMPLVSTHMPYTILPRSIVESGCKIVYIWRDPKDTFVSDWHFLNNDLLSKNIFDFVPLEDAYEEFCKGISWCGPYWDHVLGYWKASLEFPEKILILKYEELKEETRFCVKKLAEFIGYPFTKEEEETGAVKKIINMCDFQNLSNLEVNKSGEHRPGSRYPVKNHIYFRKGEIGDWKNYLTAEMGARIDKIMEEKLMGSGLSMAM